MVKKSIEVLKYHLRICLLCILHLLKILRRSEEISKSIGSHQRFKEHSETIKYILMKVYRQIKVLLIAARELLGIDERVIQDLEKLEQDLEEKPFLLVNRDEITYLESLLRETEELDRKLFHLRLALEKSFIRPTQSTNSLQNVAELSATYFGLNINQRVDIQERQELESNRTSLNPLFREFRKYLRKLVDNIAQSFRILEQDPRELRHIEQEIREVEESLKRLEGDKELSGDKSTKTRIEAQLKQIESELRK